MGLPHLLFCLLLVVGVCSALPSEWSEGIMACSIAFVAVVALGRRRS